MMEGPDKAASYWTRKRHVRKDVERHLAAIAADESSENNQQTEHRSHIYQSENADYLACSRNNSDANGGEIPALHDHSHEDNQGDYTWNMNNNLKDSFSMELSTDLSNVEDDSDTDDISDDELDEGESENMLAESLSRWSVQFGVTQAALTSLLAILKPLHPSLPNDARTLLRMKRSSGVREKAGGSYYYFGILSVFGEFLSTRFDEIISGSCLNLQINIDGLPLFKSSNAQFWPILGIIQGFGKTESKVIGLYCGSKKPSSAEEFLQDFAEDICGLEQGFQFQGKTLRMMISSVLCDAPARAYVKNIKSHNGYSGCEKCIQSGCFISNRMTFPETSSQLRTDVKFDEMLDEDHHLGPASLRNVSIGMVTKFPLDYMHLVCLGVMRRLLKMWVAGPLRNRFPAAMVRGISSKLVNLRNYIPSEFARKPRSLAELDRWKATEFRLFLLYTGPVILSEINAALYKNFLLLSVAIYILASPLFCLEHCNYARELLVLFVKHYTQLYGKEFVVYNIHGLIHLANDVKNHGPLDSISCFPFENFLKQLKKMVRKPHLPLSQVVCRLSEKSGRDFTNDIPQRKKLNKEWTCTQRVCSCFPV